ncbi:autotransporter domain-containing protein, partial [Acinetobacter sp. FNA3]|nr:autotransporter domain-containing protein [Acinetobacter pollinis]
PTTEPTPAPKTETTPAPTTEPTPAPKTETTPTPKAEPVLPSDRTVKVGVIDTGAMTKEMLKDSVMNVSRYEANTTDNSITITNITDSDINTQDIGDSDHGSIISQIIAGKDTHGSTVGLAKDNAVIYAAQTTNEKGESSFFLNLNAMLDLNQKYGVKLFNASWGGVTGEKLNQNSWQSQLSEKVIKTGSLIVFATGNEYQTQPSYNALLPVNNRNLEKGWLAVTGVDDTHQKLFKLEGRDNVGANACGDAAKWCLAADFISPAYHLDSEKDGELNRHYGTSFATPQVTATAANVWYNYPWMTSDQVRQTILTTATYIDDGSTFDPSKPYNKTTGWGYYNPEKASNGPAAFYKVFGLTFDANITSDSAFLNSIHGDAGFTKRGAATLYAIGDYTYKGDTNIKEGIFKYYGTLTGNITIDKGATVQSLKGDLLKNPENEGNIPDNTIFNNVMFNNGNLSTRGGEVSVRTYIQSNTGTLSYELGNTLKVSSGMLDGTLDIYSASQNFNLGNYQVINGRTITGKFSQAKTISPFLKLNDLKYSFESVVANIGFADATSAGITTDGVSKPAGILLNQVTTQAEKDYSTGHTESDAVKYAINLQNINSSEKAQSILNSNSGSIFAETPSVLLQNQSMVTDSIARRTNYVTDAQSGIWANTQYLNNKNGASGWDTVNSSISVITAGVDKFLNPDLLVGGYISQYRESSSYSLNRDKNRLDMIFGGLYGKYTLDNKYLSITAQYGDGDNKFDRNIDTGKSTVQTSSLGDIKSYSISSEIGYQFSPNRIWNLTPILGLSYSGIEQGRIQESNHYGLSVGKIHSDEVKAKVGLHSLATVTEQFKVGGFTEYTHALYRNLGDVSIQSNITQASTNYQAPEFKKGYVTLGVNAQYETPMKRWKFFGDIAYLNSSKDNYQGQIGVKYIH